MVCFEFHGIPIRPHLYGGSVGMELRRLGIRDASVGWELGCLGLAALGLSSPRPKYAESHGS